MTDYLGKTDEGKQRHNARTALAKATGLLQFSVTSAQIIGKTPATRALLETFKAPYPTRLQFLNAVINECREHSHPVDIQESGVTQKVYIRLPGFKG